MAPKFMFMLHLTLQVSPQSGFWNADVKNEREGKTEAHIRAVLYVKKRRLYLVKKGKAIETTACFLFNFF